ncbi:hypothetical protein NN3_11000 [Nocardia neocaledoniensis NBRC 108232]|nr:hypothetical protein NN3_11000 [Nocardia neocaledoniensis NBRC 108232]
MEDPHPPIARYLRERRESLGLTRAALSTVAGVSPGLIQKIEQGTRPPTLGALLALCAALQIPEPFRDHLVSLSLQSFPTFDVHAVNHAWTRQFPGLVPGTTLLEWMLLDPVGRTRRTASTIPNCSSATSTPASRPRSPCTIWTSDCRDARGLWSSWCRDPTADPGPFPHRPRKRIIATWRIHTRPSHATCANAVSPRG